LRILGIDFSSVVRGPWRSSEGNSQEVTRDVIQKIVDLRSGFDRVAICTDEAINVQSYPYRGDSFRKWVEPFYKFNREPMEPAYFDLIKQLTGKLSRDGCTILWAKEVNLAPIGGPIQDHYAEADDTLASLAAWCSQEKHELLIYSADKDMLQCVRDDVPVAVLRAFEGEPWNEGRVANELQKAKEDGGDVRIGVPPALVPHVQALAREGADNFAAFPGWVDPAEGQDLAAIASGAERPRGVRHPGIGLTNAIRLFRDLKFKTAYEVVEAALADDPKLSKHIKKVIQRAKPTPKEAVYRGLLLSTLITNLPVDFSVLNAPPVYSREPIEREYYVEEPMVETNDSGSGDDTLDAIDRGVDEAKVKQQAADKLVAEVEAEAISAMRASDRERYKQALIALRAGLEGLGMADHSAQAEAHVKQAVANAKAQDATSKAKEPAPASGPQQTEPGAPTTEPTAEVAPPALVQQPPAYMRQKPSTALARPAPTSVNKYALQPDGWNKVCAMAEAFAASGLYPNLGTPEKIMAVIVEGNERGMTAATACRLAYAVNGRIGWAASAMTAWVEDSGLVDYMNVVVTTREQCVIEFKRSKRAMPEGQIVRHTVTIEDARKNGYLETKGHPVWKTDPQAMLVAFCKRTCCRTYFDRIVANVYTPDELDEKFVYDVAA